MTEKPSIEELKASALKKMQAYRTVFTSPEGKAVLADLQAHFSDKSSIVNNLKTGEVDPWKSMAVSGARDVILHIEHSIGLGAIDELA